MQIPMPIRRASDHVSSRLVFFGVVVAALLILSHAAATAQSVTTKLVVVEEVALPSFADHPTAVPIKSDSEGNFGSKLAVQFTKRVGDNQPDETMFRVLNNTTGEVLGDFEGGAKTSRRAGYNDSGFLFVGAKDGKLTRVRAIPQ
jgi:hypothetical protein